MTSKTIKTILFASLIVAMILPFSGMNYATAEETNTQNDRIKLEEYKKDLVSQLKETNDKSEKRDLRLVLKRVNITLDLYEIKDQVEMSTLSQQTANEDTATLLEELDSTFDESKSQTIESEIDVSPQSGTTYFQTTTQSKFNCYTNSNPTGFNWGSVTGIDFIESYLVGVQGYPSSIAIIEGTSCNVKNFDNGYVKYRSLANGGMCTATLPNSNSVDQGYCVQFGTGHPVLITATAWYDGFNPFNLTEGWDFVWVP